MLRRRSKALAGLLVALVGLAGCDDAPAASAPSQPSSPTVGLGLMTSLPLYWPVGAGIGAIADGRGELPWQRTALEQRFAITPLDTLSAIPGLSPDAPPTDPLAGLDRLAVIQPRGLSPADNVALDVWVRQGGRLLLVLDPALTGHYDLPLGDPRRPVDSALIPPVVARWGMAIGFDETQDEAVINARLEAVALPLALPGRMTVVDPAAGQCTVLAQGAAARCRVEQGQVTVIADAAIFEHQELAGEDGTGLQAVVAEALR
ncbi:MAG: hypothetical protein EAY70_04155 [Sphingomonadales bacterium]|nr:MAG: hypothetical protein EAY70_04155 [Sphingomonadales bacterium]